MKFIGTESEGFAFNLSAQEKLLLLKTLKMFPLVPPAHHQLSKTGTIRAEDQRLLDEAVAEQRKESVKRVQIFLGEPSRFRESGKVFRLSLTRVEIEWLLQVLNDVRVGAWLALGEPEDISISNVNPKNTRYAFAMETSGYFQSALLAALGYEM